MRGECAMTPTQIIIEKQNLLSILSALQGICSRRSVMDVTANVYVECDEREITLKATDMEIAFQATIPIEMQKETKGSFARCSFLLNAKRWYEVVKDLGSIIKIEYDGTTCSMIADTIQAKLLVRPSDDFPEMPEKIENIVLIKKQDIVQSLDWTAFVAISSGGSNQALQSILLEIDQEKIVFTATDGHCLAHATTKMHNEKDLIQNKRKWLLSKRSALELKKILDESKESDILIGTCSSYIVFSGVSFNFFAKTSSEKFPEYAAALDKTNYKECFCKKDDLTKALRRANAMLGGKFIPAQFEITPDALHLSLNNKETGTISETIKLESSEPIEEKVKLFLYTPYLLQGISKMNTSAIRMYVYGSKKPLMIEEQSENGHFIYLVMPVLQT